MSQHTPLGVHHGYGSPRSIIATSLITGIVAFPAHAESTELAAANTDLIAKALFALGTVLIAQAIIPLVKAWYLKRKLRATYCSYLMAHVETTLEHFQGAGSTHFAQKHLIEQSDADWFKFLSDENIGVPAIFLNVITVIEKTLTHDKYIPSISYFGLGENLLDHTNPIWEINTPVSKFALRYFLTQQQVQSSLDYQYSGWYFDLIKSDTTDRERWCKGLENVLFDMAQHYKAARELKTALSQI